MVGRTALSALLLLTSLPLFAQAPRITQQGDPSVKSDTIYRLAVKPENHPKESAVFLLDDGVVRLEADGRGTQTFRQVIQILKPEAVEDYREFSFGYAPGHEKFTLNWIRVVDADGKVISAGPSHVQDSDIPAEMGDPVYTDQKVKRVSLSGVAPGVIVDYSITREELKPYLPGDFFQSWSVSTGLTVKRSRFIVDVPKTLNVRLHERNLNFPRKTVETRDRKIFTWIAADVPRVETEPFAADSNDVVMQVALSSPLAWQDIGRWFAGLAKDRFTLGSVAAAKLQAVVKGARSREDSIRAVHKWVAQDIRYISIALGMGGYQPRMSDSVVVTGFGDCKDKAMLFVASLDALGITAYPVLLNSTGVPYRELATIEQLDHAIAAVKTENGYVYTDLTSEFTPYGELPYGVQGELGLVVHPDGTTEERTLPISGPADNHSYTRITGVLSPDGYFNGRYEERTKGTLQYGLRNVFEHPLDSAEKQNIVNSVASKYFDGAEGDSLVGFAGKDLAVMPRVTMLIKRGKATTSAGATEIFAVPLGNMSGLATAAKELEAKERRFPVNAESIFGNRSTEIELRVTLPPGWKAQLPKNVTAKGAYGSYESEYAQEGNELVIRRRTSGARGVHAPDKIREVATWFREMARDDAKFIVLVKN